jgi:hypothetical protein
MRVSVVFLAGMFALTIFPTRAIEENSVLTYHGNFARSGHFVVPGLTWERARSLRPDPAFRAQLDGSLYAQPLYWRPADANNGMLLGGYGEQRRSGDRCDKWHRAVETQGWRSGDASIAAMREYQPAWDYRNARHRSEARNYFF